MNGLFFIMEAASCEGIKVDFKVKVPKFSLVFGSNFHMTLADCCLELIICRVGEKVDNDRQRFM